MSVLVAITLLALLLTKLHVMSCNLLNYLKIHNNVMREVG